MFTWYWLHTMWANDVRPYGILGRVCYAAKSLRSLRIYICYGLGKTVQIFAPISPLYNIELSCAFFLIKSAPSRLTPHEALPPTPQGTLSLDPASPLTPGLSLRFISRYARCWGHNFGQLCSFLIPNFSLLTLLALPLVATTVK